MAFIQDITQKKIKKQIDKILKKNNKNFKYLEEAQSILLLIDADNQNILRNLEQIKNYLKKKVRNIKTIYFTKEKLGKKDQPKPDTIYVDKNILKNKNISNFAKSKSDITFLFTTSEDIRYQYLLALFPAELRVGPDFKNSIADINFVIKGDDIKEYLNMIEHYLVDKHKNKDNG
jgi:ABC-type antimicrobial peptide transport system permease subunit